VNLLADDLNHVNDTESLILLLLLAFFWSLRMCAIMALLNTALFGVFFHNSLAANPPVQFVPACLPSV